VDLRIDGDRLRHDLTQLAMIGATPGGGVTRLALTDEDRAGRDLLQTWMRDAGLQVRIDDVGNMTGRRNGAADGPAVVLASHIDSVRQGGQYDGAYGVLAALAVARALNEASLVTRLPIEIVNWTNEEGVRFEPAMLCSGLVAGRFGLDEVYDRRDRDGLRFGDELQRIGYAGSFEHRPGPARAYLELHIEQGPVLEDAGLPVGVVEGIVGITWLELTINGHADHAGPSPMPLRRDALAAAARVISAVERLANETADAVGTVGRLSIEPNVINTIPGRVVFSVDFRHRDPDVLDALVSRLRVVAEETMATTGVAIEIDRFWTSEPTTFDEHVVNVVAAACQSVGVPSVRLWSGAGHDAKYAQDIWPAGMIFVRSKDGLSHCEAEYSAPDDLVAGANALLQATIALAE